MCDVHKLLFSATWPRNLASKPATPGNEESDRSTFGGGKSPLTSPDQLVKRIQLGETAWVLTCLSYRALQSASHGNHHGSGSLRVRWRSMDSISWRILQSCILPQASTNEREEYVVSLLQLDLRESWARLALARTCFFKPEPFPY